MATPIPVIPFDGTNQQSDISWNYSAAPDSETFSYTEAFATLTYLTDLKIDLPDTCGKGTLGQIDTALLNFFTALKGIQKYGELYVFGTINKIQNITNLISQTADIIGSILKILIQRARNWLMKEIRRLIQLAIEYLLPTIAKVFKDIVIDEIVKQILCAFDKIIDGLVDLIVDFLYAFVQEIVNPVFCAVQGFTNSLINNIASIIDDEIQPILNNITDVLGGAVKIVGSIFEAIDFILGFESFLCQQPNCPEVKSFKQGPWGGPTQSQIDDFNNFASVPSSSSIVEGADAALAQFFGKSSNTYAGPLNCNTNPYVCGPPNVEIFGGGGAGAVGKAIVNSIGQVVGVDLLDSGDGYTSPPFVTFTDNCNNGKYASAYSIIDKKDKKVKKIVMKNNGKKYLNAPDGKDEFKKTIGPKKRDDEEFEIPNDLQGTQGLQGNQGLQGVQGLQGPLSNNQGTQGTQGPLSNNQGTQGLQGIQGGGGGTGGGGTGGGGTGGGGTGGGGTGGGGEPIKTEIREYVGCLSEFQILSTGIGYTINDTIIVTPDIPNLEATVKLTPQGQIISIDITNIPCDLSEVPEISINSNTGSGAKILPILSFTRVNNIEQFDPQALRNFKPEKLIRVIDCVKQ